MNNYLGMFFEKFEKKIIKKQKNKIYKKFKKII